MTEAQRCVVHGHNTSRCQLQHLQRGLLGGSLQGVASQVNNAVEIILIYDGLRNAVLIVQEILACGSNLPNLGNYLVQLVQVEAQVGSQIHIGEAGGHGKALVMGLRCQIDSVAVLCALCALGQRSVLIAGHKQVIKVIAYALCRVHSSDGLR